MFARVLIYLQTVIIGGFIVYMLSLGGGGAAVTSETNFVDRMAVCGTFL
jgi:hypothetical protein